MDQVLIQGSGIEADEIRQARNSHRRLESTRLGDDPVRHVPAIARSGNAQMARVYFRMVRENVIDTSHQILIIAASPVANRAVRKFLTIAGAASWVDRQCGVSARRIQLDRRHESIPELSVRAA